MDGVNIFDVVAISLIALLGLKGLFSGFFKEAFGLAGILGGVYFGSRYGVSVAESISDNLFKLDNPNTMMLVGFVVVLISFWVLMIIAGKLLSSMMKLSGLGGLDRLLGFSFGAGKVFVVVSIITYALMNITVIKANTVDYTKDSMMIPVFTEVGSKILKIKNPFSEEKILADNNTTKKG
ncbi:MAG: CvpA family protein [Campylobacterales bacterium]